MNHSDTPATFPWTLYTEVEVGQIDQLDEVTKRSHTETWREIFAAAAAVDPSAVAITFQEGSAVVKAAIDLK